MIKFVPQQEAWVIERFGKFNRILQPGLNFLVPFIDQVKYVQSLKEIVLAIPSQSAVTNGTQRSTAQCDAWAWQAVRFTLPCDRPKPDNVTLNLDGVLFLRIVDPYKVCVERMAVSG